MYYTAERLARYKAENPDWRDKPFILVPDLVVGVISSNDKYTEVAAKADKYLEDGVRMVWIADPKRRTMTVRTAAQYFTLGIDDTLNGGEVIPDFTVKLTEIFE